MFKKFGVLAMILTAGLAVFTPAVAQARDWDDHRHFDRRVERRDFERERREFAFREPERRVWHAPIYFNPYRPLPRPYYPAPYCPR